VLDFHHRFYEGLELLSVQINSVPLPLINFRKFITSDEKWILYFKRRKLWVNCGQRHRR